MQWMRLRARGCAAGLGLVAALGFAEAAGAESPLCDCTIQNQRVEPADSCLVVDMGDYCGGSIVRNTCGVSVLLVDWPLRGGPCINPTCTAQLPPGQEARFNFNGTVIQGEHGTPEATYRVQIGDGAEQSLTVAADVMCRSLSSDEDQGCAAAPGALAALGVLMLTVPLARWRRRA
ncbi:hypothetical protein JY651_16600 [Pyxidicoccus parkwayensis]|uniref:MYXO-CTERM domain-containing protein n=1 Tax=Pyxidicoccus parkwayensis TaxID=2813578 RepID=A0ABX7P7L4_9BACT|nr:MXAN_0125 family MYXO-CTERM protein [Pyxidicoccus parkwaysis]QSQ26446.1 hypothetical protein JY651_16600 [Pyxidicoccus parkwaysis]